MALRAHSSSSAASGADGLKEQIKRVFDACAEPGVKRQLGYILGRHRVNFVAHDDGACRRKRRMCCAAKVGQWLNGTHLTLTCSSAYPLTPPPTRAADIDALIGNAHLPELYAALARDLDTAEPKTPEDIYKAHLAGDKRDVAEKARRNGAPRCSRRPLLGE